MGWAVGEKKKMEGKEILDGKREDIVVYQVTHCVKRYTFLISFHSHRTPFEVGSIIIPILQMKREVLRS